MISSVRLTQRLGDKRGSVPGGRVNKVGKILFEGDVLNSLDSFGPETSGEEIVNVSNEVSADIVAFSPGE